MTPPARPYYLFVDEYGGRGYIPLGTDDLENPDWQVASDYDLPASPRHGTVIPVTAAELAALRDGIVIPEEPTPVVADENGLVAQYDLDESAGTAARGQHRPRVRRRRSAATRPWPTAR